MENDFFDEDVKPSKISRAVVAGASEALRLKSKDWKKSDEEVMQDIANRIEEIVGEID